MYAWLLWCTLSVLVQTALPSSVSCRFFGAIDSSRMIICVRSDYFSIMVLSRNLRTAGNFLIDIFAYVLLSFYSTLVPIIMLRCAPRLLAPCLDRLEAILVSFFGLWCCGNIGSGLSAWLLSILFGYSLFVVRITMCVAPFDITVYGSFRLPSENEFFSVFLGWALRYDYCAWVIASVRVVY